MIRILLLLTAFSFLQLGFSKPNDELTSNPFEYKWLNKKFPIDTLISYEGDTLILSKSSKNYVINFWFTSCPPCIAEIKWLNKLKREYQSAELEFLAVSFESKQQLTTFLESHDFSLQQFYLEQQVINENYLAIGYPTTIILDKTEKVIFQKSGGHNDPDKAVEIYQLIAKELEKHKLAKSNMNQN